MEGLGATLFCDDIRFELNNKMTLVGCYGTELLFQGEFPLNIPKLGLFVQIRLPKGMPAVSKILVHLPGQDESQAIQVEIGSPTAASVAAVNSPPPEAGVVMLLATNVPIVLNMFRIEQAGLIKVRAVCGEHIIKCGTLKVSQMAQPQMP